MNEGRAVRLPALFLMKKSVSIFLAFCICWVIGCSRDDLTVAHLNSGETWNSLTSQAVLVRANEWKLTKENVELQADFLAHVFSFVHAAVPVATIEKFRISRLPKIVRSLVGRKLIYDHVVRSGIVAEKQDVEAVTDEFCNMLGRGGTNRLQKFTSGLPERLKRLFETSLAEDAAVNAYWRIKFPSLYVVTDEDIKDVEDEVAEKNKQAAKLTQDSWAKARKALERVKAEDFTIVADEMSALKREDDEMWNEEFHPSEFEALFPELVAKLSKMEPGEVSGILELDDGLHILKLFARKGSGVVSVVNENPESLNIGHIVIQLPVEYRAAPRQQIIFETRNLRLQAERKKLLGELEHEAGVEFLFGTNFWAKSFGSRVRAHESENHQEMKGNMR